MDDALQKAIVALLGHKTGIELRYGDDIGPRLSLADKGDRFVVTYQPMTDETLDSTKYPPQRFQFDDAELAADRFLLFRRSLRLGLDFEDPVRHYNPAHGDHKTCACGHSYIRHFNIDTAAAMPCQRCGCKEYH